MITGAENISFIPKKNSTSNKPVKKSLNLIFLVTLIVFLLTLFFATGVFLYKGFLKGKIEESKIMLEREKDNFDIGSIKQLIRLDDRLLVSETLLKKHIDLTGLFQTLQENTLKAVQFKNFKFKVGDDGGMDVLMDGVTNDYETVALQADIFGNDPFFKNTIFSNLDVNNDGKVVFSFSAIINKDLVSYKKRIENSK